MNNQFISPKKEVAEIISSEVKFKGIFPLLKECWRIYYHRFQTLLGITMFPVGFSLLFLILIYFLSGTNVRYSIWFSITGTISYLGSLFLQLWVIPSLLYSIRDNTGIRESYKKGLQILISYIWVYFLFSVIVAGGFLLFIIPGILFSIWFSLAIYALLFEEKKGMNALFRSKDLVSRRFWKVFWRFLILGLVIGIIFSIVIVIITSISFLFEISKQRAGQMVEIVGYLSRLFIIPVILIYGTLIYQNLRDIKKEIPYQEPSKKRKLKYLLPGVLGILVVGLIFAIQFMNIFLGRDESPVDDSDLRLSKIEIPKEENAFYYLYPYVTFYLSDPLKKEIITKYWPEGKEKIKETKKIYWPGEKSELIENILEGEEWDEEFVKELLENNEEVFSDFEKAVSLAYYQDPIVRDPEKIDFLTPFFPLSNLRTIAKLNLIKSVYLFNQGKEKEAFDQTIKVIKFGQILENSPRPTPILYLVGMKIKETGTERLRTILPRTRLSSEELRNYIEKLKTFTENEAGLARIFKMEYISFTNYKVKFIDAPIKEGKFPILVEQLYPIGDEGISPPQERKIMIKTNYLYKSNQTQRMFAEHFRNIFNNTNKDYYNQMEFPEIQQYLVNIPHPLIGMIFTENYLGKALHDIIVVDFGSIFAKKCLEDFSIIGTQLLMAIKAYQLETGKIPSSLSELVPEYFSEVPKDPFDGKPIRYSPEKKIIYSVGKDLIDFGGSDEEGLIEEPTFKIEF